MGILLQRSLSNKPDTGSSLYKTAAQYSPPRYRSTANTLGVDERMSVGSSSARLSNSRRNSVSSLGAVSNGSRRRVRKKRTSSGTARLKMRSSQLNMIGAVSENPELTQNDRKVEKSKEQENENVKALFNNTVADSASAVGVNESNAEPRRTMRRRSSVSDFRGRSLKTDNNINNRRKSLDSMAEGGKSENRKESRNTSGRNSPTRSVQSENIVQSVASKPVAVSTTQNNGRSSSETRKESKTVNSMSGQRRSSMLSLTPLKEEQKRRKSLTE